MGNKKDNCEVMETDEYYNIAKLETSHWWYKSLHVLVLKHIQEHFKNKEINIIDAGCGTGGLIAFLKGNGYHQVEGFDLSPTALKLCSDNNFFAFRGDLKNISKYYTENSADVIISNDTFYFLSIQEQKMLADDMNRILRNNGILITNMPSLKIFSGVHDLKVGIKKRFEEENIWTIFNRNKYTLTAKTYWPFLLSPIIWLSRYVQRLKMKYTGEAEIRSDVKDQGKFINSVLFSLTKIENDLFSTKPLGSSLFLVMKKKSIV